MWQCCLRGHEVVVRGQIGYRLGRCHRTLTRLVVESCVGLQGTGTNRLDYVIIGDIENGKTVRIDFLHEDVHGPAVWYHHDGLVYSEYTMIALCRWEWFIMRMYRLCES
jgi:hypothetical protein